MIHSTEIHLEDSLSNTPEREASERLTFRAGIADLPLKGEDRMYFDRDKGLFVVCDGVGGGINGGDTAQAAVDDFAANHSLKDIDKVDSPYQVRTQLDAAFQSAEKRITRTLGEYAGSTTTAAVKFFSYNSKLHLIAGNVGDSRIMLWRDGFMSDITAEQCDPDNPHVITNWLGRDSHNRRVHGEMVVMSLTKGDKVILCSDGITGDKGSERLTNAEFAEALAVDDPTEAAQRLVATSKKHDDKSVIVINIEATNEAAKPSLNLKNKLSHSAKHVAGFIAGLGLSGRPRNQDVTKPQVAQHEQTAQTSTWKDRLTSRETYSALRKRARHGFTAAKDTLLKLYLTTENQIVSLNKRPEELTEKQLQHRRWVLNGAIGLLAAWGAYKAFHGFQNSGNSNLHEHVPPHGQQSASPEVPHAPQVIAGETLEPKVPAAPNHLALHEHGSTIWGSIDTAAEKRGVNLSDAQIQDLVSRTLEHNNLSWEDARHLPVGFRFTIPEEVRRALEEAAKK